VAGIRKRETPGCKRRRVLGPRTAAPSEHKNHYRYTVARLGTEAKELSSSSRSGDEDVVCKQNTRRLGGGIRLSIPCRQNESLLGWRNVTVVQSFQMGPGQNPTLWPVKSGQRIAENPRLSHFGAFFSCFSAQKSIQAFVSFESPFLRPPRDLSLQTFNQNQLAQISVWR